MRVRPSVPRRRTLTRMSLGDYPGAVAPARQYMIDVGGLGLAVHEWGDEAGQPLFLVHGGFDFARTYEVFAPKLAAAGWRVVAWDQRGHGDSDHAPLYGWDADIRDAMAVMDAVTQRPAPVIGHSKGGSLMIQLADAQPYRFSHLVNLDGLPSQAPGARCGRARADADGRQARSPVGSITAVAAPSSLAVSRHDRGARQAHGDG